MAEVTSHLRLEGGWAVCPTPESCELAFHVPGMTPAEAEALPSSVLESLLAVVDPPVSDKYQGIHAQHWMERHPRTGAWQVHHDYDLPAIVYSEGSREWYQRGQKHRGGDRPAEVDSDGTQKWYRRGSLHRLGDKPAMVNGTWETWYFAGMHHRNWGKPADVLKDEHGAIISRKWWLLGMRHRLFGPAVIQADGSTEWWLFGRKVWPRRTKGWPHGF